MELQTVGAYVVIGLHILFVLVGIILIVFKQVRPGFAFFTTGTAAPILIGLAVIGLIPTAGMFFVWLFVYLCLILLAMEYLKKKWQTPKEENATA